MNPQDKSKEVTQAEDKHFEIYKWLLGYTDFPERKEKDGIYYWRSYLRAKLELIGIHTLGDKIYTTPPTDTSKAALGITDTRSKEVEKLADEYVLNALNMSGQEAYIAGYNSSNQSVIELLEKRIEQLKKADSIAFWDVIKELTNIVNNLKEVK